MKHFINDIELSQRNINSVIDSVLQDIENNVYTKYRQVDANNEYSAYIEFSRAKGDISFDKFVGEEFNGRGVIIDTPFFAADEDEKLMKTRMMECVNGLKNKVIKYISDGV